MLEAAEIQSHLQWEKEELEQSTEAGCDERNVISPPPLSFQLRIYMEIPDSITRLRRIIRDEDERAPRCVFPLANVSGSRSAFYRH